MSSKNLKRGSNDGGPATNMPRAAARGAKAGSTKRHKQTTLMGFLSKTPAHAEETPVLHAKPATAAVGSTGLQRGFCGLGLKSNAKPHPEGSDATAAPTQAVFHPPEPRRAEPAYDDGDDFVISMSQTYERTQPEPCSHFAGVEHEDIELSLRRTQTCHTSQPTQPYNQLYDRAAGTSLAGPAGTSAAAATSTAWESSVAEASACGERLGAGGALAQGANLEGQGSNQPHEARTTAAGAANALRGGAAAASTLRDSTDTLELRPHGAAGPVSSTGPAVTPEMPGACCCTAGDVADDGTTPPQQGTLPLFPIFGQNLATRRQLGPVFLVRHGESEYNAACNQRRSFGDPTDIFDARLTQLGREQARKLRPKMLDLARQHGDPLFIVSPLARAIETFLHMLPDPERLDVRARTPPPALPPSSAAQREAASTSAPLPGDDLRGQPLRVEISPLVTEFLQTCGDVGRPRSVLMKEYPKVAEQLGKGIAKERWWYEDGGRKNCAETKVLASKEPKAILEGRVNRFRHHLRMLTHRGPVVVVGHACFFRALLCESTYMKNCEVLLTNI